MRIKLILFSMISLLALANNASAQCQAGIVTPNCVPYEYWPGASGNNSPGNSPQAPAYVPPQPVWQDRWGAIAIDREKGITIVTNDRVTESDATRRVMAGCMEDGGNDCKVILTYDNQCGALAADSRWAYATTKSGQVRLAESAVLESCEKDAGGVDCKVIYSGCSYPARIN